MRENFYNDRGNHGRWHPSASSGYFDEDRASRLQRIQYPGQEKDRRLGGDNQSLRSGANNQRADRGLPYDASAPLSNPTRPVYGFNLPTSERLRTRADSLRTDTLDTNTFGGPNLAVTSGILLRGFTEKTTSHGIPHVYFATGMLKKFIWGVVSAAGFVVLILHCYLLIATWRGAEVGTQISSVQKRKLPFPAVTICNYNTLKASSLRDVGGTNIQSLVEVSHGRVGQGPPRQRPSVKKDLLKNLAYEYAALTDEQFAEIGHNASELALFCSFHGEACDDEDFYFFRDNRYGNCVTLNAGRTADGYIKQGTGDVKASSVAGPDFGLSFVIFVEEYEYLPVMTEAVGAHIVIHNQTTMPFPDQQAISVTTGNVVNIGIEKKVIERLSGRYGNCTEPSEASDNIYHDKHKVDYSLNACLKTCFQREVLKECLCHHPTVPYLQKSRVFSSKSEGLPLCNETLPIISECLEKVQDRYEDGDLACDYCNAPCKEVQFKASYSSAVWPAPLYLGDFTDSLLTEYPDIMDRIDYQIRAEARRGSNVDFKAQREEYIKSNFLQVNVYYEQMQVSVHKEISIYDDYQFASDLGGSFGLWMGWSILTMVEFIELAMDLLVFLCYSRCGKNTERKQSRNQLNY